MLEVNDFNAIHISLASPEQVRGLARMVEAYARICLPTGG